MHSTCLFLEILLIFSAIFCAALPLTPVSISSNISVLTGSVFAKIVLIASIILDSSPPEAILERGFKGAPAFTEIKNEKEEKKGGGGREKKKTNEKSQKSSERKSNEGEQALLCFKINYSGSTILKCTYVINKNV